MAADRGDDGVMAVGPSASMAGPALGRAWSVLRTQPRSWWVAVAAVAALNVVGWAVAATGPTVVLGLALTAWLLGARHAFDPDHIAAIDTATRTLSADPGRRAQASAAGFWFALGHSTLVMILAAATGAGAGAITAHLFEATAWAPVASLLGLVVATTILLGLGAYNLWCAYRMGRSPVGEPASTPGGLVGRLLPHLTAGIASPARMWLVGLVFGLGFDTATEVSLLVLAATAGVAAPAAALALPVLFCAGMTLCDTADSTILTAAYQWATARTRARLIRSITALSGGLALAIGALQAWGVLEQAFGLPSADGIDPWWAGYAAAVTVAVLWIVAAATRRPQPSA